MNHETLIFYSQILSVLVFYFPKSMFLQDKLRPLEVNMKKNISFIYMHIEITKFLCPSRFFFYFSIFINLDTEF